MGYHPAGLPWWLSGKESHLQCRRPRFDPWVKKIPWRRKWQPTPVVLPGEFHGLTSLIGYSPWDHKELDMTEWLTLSLFHYIPLLNGGCMLESHLLKCTGHSWSFSPPCNVTNHVRTSEFGAQPCSRSWSGHDSALREGQLQHQAPQVPSPGAVTKRPLLLDTGSGAESVV